jgi:glycosyltransferase involved in cell wall biosynthesis
VIPCFNEEAAIGKVVEGVRQHLRSVLVVDDGSRDATESMAAESGAQVERLSANRGKGAALQAGCRRAHQQGFRWALVMDGDGQHSADDIPAFFDCAESTGADLIVGNRMRGAKTMPFVRKFVNEWMSETLSEYTNRRLPDSQCGFRLINLEAWSKLRIRANHFEIESETLLAFIRAGYQVEFVPIRVIYKKEQSKIHPVWDTLRWFKWWIRARIVGVFKPAAKSAPQSAGEPRPR